MPHFNLDSEDSIVLICGSPRLREEVMEIFNAMDYRNYFIFK